MHSFIHSFIVWVSEWLIDWLIDAFIHTFIHCLSDWLIDCLLEWLIDWVIGLCPCQDVRRPNIVRAMLSCLEVKNFSLFFVWVAQMWTRFFVFFSGRIFSFFSPSETWGRGLNVSLGILFFGGHCSPYSLFFFLFFFLKNRHVGVFLTCLIFFNFFSGKIST